MTTPSPEVALPIALPSCAGVEAELADEDLVSALPREDLIRRLAERGMEGARDLLAEEERKGGRVAERLTSLRERLRRQFSRQIHHLQDDYQRKGDELDSLVTRQRKLLQDELGKLDSSIQNAGKFTAADLGADGALLEAVRAALLLPSEALQEASQEPKPTLWERIRAFFARLLAALRRLFGGKGTETRVKAPSPGRPVTLGRLSALGRTLAPANAGDLLTSMTPQQLEALRASARDNLQRKGRELTEAEKAQEEEARRRRRALEEEAQAALEERRRRQESEVRDGVDREVARELRERNLVRPAKGGLAVTYALVDKFARLVLEEESQSLPDALRMSLKGGASTGLYEKGRLRQADEVARMDIVGSLVESRLRGSRHILEDASYVYREVRSESVHAVLLLDVSGSMAEGEKLTAAKKAFLALYMAIHRKYPDATIDVAVFDNRVRVLDLVALWEAKAGSFTNTGDALQVARDLLVSSRATRRELYLITDGLPEAYSEEGGEVKSGNLPRAQEYALERAQALRSLGPLAATVVLLKSDDPAYERAARELAHVLGGSVVITDPRRLAFELLVRFVGERVEEKVPRAPTPSPDARTASAPSGPIVGDTAKARRKARRAARSAGEVPG